jgi:serine/threonine protein kinase/Tfp pilus assembly protein PilF
MSCLLRAGIGSEEETVHDSTPDALEGGLRFGMYEIDCREDGRLYELGRGAMGVTYRATDTSLQRKVALKIIKIDIAERSADARERFMREARAAASLRHENIATVYQFGMRLETGQYFYAMELIEGETVEERVRRAGPLDARTTIKIAQQVTSALTAAEKHGLVHRDLKPANLMLVSTDGETAHVTNNTKLVVKIIDFGLAKAIHTQTDPKSLTHDRFVGTPAFASPEQFEHAALDVRSDIYSLGETLWFALTGKTPFAGRSVEEIHRAQQSKVLPIEQLKAAHVPARLRLLLESMLAFEPASRPGTSELAARLQRCSPEARSVRHTRFAFAAAAFVILGMSALFVFQPSRIRNAALNPASDKSIAVLPFENLSEEKANAFFAEGVQDEILTDLAKIADLKVISRTSVLQYKSGVARNLREIAQQLGVANVVEGSVQRSGNRVRVNAQLVDARTDAHLWAETYDRDLADVFAIQSEIAKAIADQLQAKLSPNEKKAIEEPPTKDLAAYDLYVHAKLLMQTGFFDGDKLFEAARLLDQAIARDPDFFLAYCLSAEVNSRLYWAFDHKPARRDLADGAVKAALRLRPEAGEAHLERARFLYMCNLDYDHARAELAIARPVLPNSAQVFALMGHIDRLQGRWNESARNYEKALELDPRNLFTLQQTAIGYRYMRRFAESAATMDRAIAVAPRDAELRAFRAWLDLLWRADSRPLHKVFETMMNENALAAALTGEIWLDLAMCERDPVLAERALASVGDGFYRNQLHFSRTFLEACVARAFGDDAAAQKAFTAARSEFDRTVREQPDEGPPLCMLGLIDAGLGRKEESIREGRRAAELTPITKDAVRGAHIMQFLGVIYAWTGEKDLAIKQIAATLQVPSLLSYGELRLHPFWDPLRGDPRFEKIVASLAPKER